MRLPKLVGVGIYGIAEASRLTGVNKGRIGRWVRGYRYTVLSGQRHSKPVWEADLVAAGMKLLTFRDLLEVRFVNAFREEGVPWKVIRAVEQKAKEEFGISHPFCTKRFKTDGHRIFTEVLSRSGERVVVNFLNNQTEFRAVMDVYLRDVDFEGQTPTIWWLLGRDHGVVADPERSFGQPIVVKEGVPTIILAKAYAVEKSIRKVAEWYEVEEASVRDAVQFELNISVAA